jgi:predicted MFS family arabinose efflux permease
MDMGLNAYRIVLASRDVRRVLLLSLVIRVPMWAGNVILTLHVVSHLGRSYGAAGLVTGVATIALSLSAPWRGRRLDQVGLRRTVAPSLLILAACWSVAPFVGYWPLLGLAALAGLFVVPSFSIVRQALIHAVDEEHRKSALSIDSVVIEISFMIGPAIGVLLATYWNTSWALFTCEFASILGGVVLWLADPALRSAADREAEFVAHSIRTWVTAPVVAVLIMCVAATLVLSGTDVGIVAALRHAHHQSWIGWVLAVWGLGSAVGGLAYGMVHRSLPVVGLLALLSAATLPVALAGNVLGMAALLFVAGVFCAPTITASVDALSRAVPERFRGEALGWHGSAMTAGSALGAPIAGVAIDRVGWQGAFTVTAALGLLAAAGSFVAMRSGRAASPSQSNFDQDEPTEALEPAATKPV